MATFEPVLLRRVGKASGQSLAGYRADGGYQGLKKALGMAPDDVTKIVKDSGLRKCASTRGIAFPPASSGTLSAEKPSPASKFTSA